MGAPKGNQNAAKAKRWTAAIERALARKGGSEMKALDAIADKFVKAADAGPSYEKGDPWLGVLSHLGDRLEGKPAQVVVGPGGEGEHKLEITHRVA